MVQNVHYYPMKEMSCLNTDVSVMTVVALWCMRIADDSTYSVSHKDQNELSDKLSENFSIMANYLTSNLLKVNSDKTHLIVMTTEQKRRHHPTTARIVTQTEVIEPTQVERLL